MQFQLVFGNSSHTAITHMERDILKLILAICSSNEYRLASFVTAVGGYLSQSEGSGQQMTVRYPDMQLAEESCGLRLSDTVHYGVKKRFMWSVRHTIINADRGPAADLQFRDHQDRLAVTLTVTDSFPGYPKWT